MDAETANKVYESNKKHIADKIEILDLALASMEDAIREAYDKGALQGAYIDIDEFRDRQAHLIFEKVMDLSTFQVEEISRGTHL